MATILHGHDERAVAALAPILNGDAEHSDSRKQSVSRRKAEAGTAHSMICTRTAQKR